MRSRLHIIVAITAIQALSCTWAWASAPEARAIVGWLENVFTLPSLLPGDLRRTGLDVRFRELREQKNGQKMRIYAVVSGLQRTREMVVRYEIAWGGASPAAHFSMHFHAGAPCITEELLTARLGGGYRREAGPVIRVDDVRHPYLGPLPPPGAGTLPAKDERIIYTTAGNLGATFFFSHACVYRLELVDRRPADWSPPPDGPPLGAFGNTPQGRRVNVEQRVAHWRAHLHDAVPLNSPKATLIAWLDSEGIRHRGASGTQSLIINFEELTGDGVVCSGWSITAFALFHPTGHVKDYQVNVISRCL
jgi:hypothetical protein